MRIERLTLGDDGLDRLTPLLDAARDHDGHAPLGEHKWLDLVHGGREGFAGLVAIEDDAPIGYAHLSRHPGERHQWGLELVLHPAHRGHDLASDLLAAALDVARAEGGGHLHMWVFQPEAADDTLAAGYGLSRGRELLHLTVALPVTVDAPLPAGVTVRAFRDGDAAGWLEVNNAAFEHHPEQGAWTRETLERRMREPWFSADDFLIAEGDGGIVGFNWTKLDHDASVGEIYVIGVHPSQQGAGLGKALAIVGLKHMHAAGMSMGSLYTDEGNRAAIAMYRSLGFTVDHHDRAYVIDL